MYSKIALRLLLVTGPFVVLLLAAEIFCRTCTAVVIRKAYMQQHAANTEVLVLGNSHSQRSIDVTMLSRPAVSLALGGQPLSIDLRLLEKVIDRMPRLHTVILEVSPHRFYYDLMPGKWNTYMYHAIYGITYKTERFSLKNYSLVLAQHKECIQLFLRWLNPLGQHISRNEQGFALTGPPGRFAHLQYDTARIRTTFLMNHTFRPEDGLDTNKRCLQRIAHLCHSRGLRLVLVATPVYRTYAAQLPAHARLTVATFLHSITTRYGLQYFDHANDTGYSVRDFTDDNHLRPQGAAKFTTLFNKELFPPAR